jgi:hypothetical protein
MKPRVAAAIHLAHAAAADERDDLVRADPRARAQVHWTGKVAGL